MLLSTKVDDCNVSKLVPVTLVSGDVLGVNVVVYRQVLLARKLEMFPLNPLLPICQTPWVYVVAMVVLPTDAPFTHIVIKFELFLVTATWYQVPTVMPDSKKVELNMFPVPTKYGVMRVPSLKKVNPPVLITPINEAVVEAAAKYIQHSTVNVPAKVVQVADGAVTYCDVPLKAALNDVCVMAAILVPAS